MAALPLSHSDHQHNRSTKPLQRRAKQGSRQRAGRALPERDLETAARHGLERFRDARVREFVPLLVERQVRADLQMLADNCSSGRPGC
jgi:hypothetical protein